MQALNFPHVPTWIVLLFHLKGLSASCEEDRSRTFSIAGFLLNKTLPPGVKKHHAGNHLDKSNVASFAPA